MGRATKRRVPRLFRHGRRGEIHQDRTSSRTRGHSSPLPRRFLVEDLDKVAIKDSGTPRRRSIAVTREAVGRSELEPLQEEPVPEKGKGNLERAIAADGCSA